MCPMLWCRDTFEDQSETMRHLVKCDWLRDAWYWCPRCSHPEHFMGYQKAGGPGREHFQRKKRLILKSAVKFFRSLGRKSTSKDEPTAGSSPGVRRELSSSEEQVTEMEDHSSREKPSHHEIYPELDGSYAMRAEMNGSCFSSHLGASRNSRAAELYGTWCEPSELSSGSVSRQRRTDRASYADDSFSAIPPSPPLGSRRIFGRFSFSDRFAASRMAGRTKYHDQVPPLGELAALNVVRSEVFGPDPIARIDSSESEVGFTSDGIPRYSFHRRYQSNNPPNSSVQSSESKPTISPVDNRCKLTHLDFSNLEVADPTPLDTSQTLSAEFSSESEAPCPRHGSNRQTRGLVTPFHCSSSSRPAIRRSIFHRPFSFETNVSDSNAWQTLLDSVSVENPSHVPRFPSVRHSRGVDEGVPEESDGEFEEIDGVPEESDESPSTLTESVNIQIPPLDDYTWQTRAESTSTIKDYSTTLEHVENLRNVFTVVKHEWQQRLSPISELLPLYSKSSERNIFVLGMTSLKRFLEGVPEYTFDQVFALMHVASASSYILHKADKSYCWDKFYGDMQLWQTLISDDGEKLLFSRVVGLLWVPEKLGSNPTHANHSCGTTLEGSALGMLRDGQVSQDCRIFLAGRRTSPYH